MAYQRKYYVLQRTSAKVNARLTGFGIERIRNLLGKRFKKFSSSWYGGAIVPVGSRRSKLDITGIS